MDSRLANPFHHAFILVSKISNPGKKIEVKHAWGFNPMPCSNSETYWSQFKKSLGFDLDFQGGFGILKVEEMRYLDLGYALHGLSFEIEVAQYKKLKNLCEHIILDQEKAVNEAKLNLKHLNREPLLHEIFEEEKRCAEFTQRKSRLRPFKICLSVNSSGLSLNESFNCKTMAMEIMREIGIPEEHLNSLTQKNASPSLPIYSGELEDIYFHSVGARHEFQSGPSGMMTLFKKWGDSKLFWSLPPQRIANSREGNNIEYYNHEYTLPSEWVKQIKQTISRLQQIENVVAQAKIDYQYESYRYVLLRKVGELYEKFSTMNAQTDYIMYDDDLSKANHFLMRVYHAMNDNYFEQGYIESIAALLDYQSQEKICDILQSPLNKIERHDEKYNDEENVEIMWHPAVSLTRF